MHDKKQTLIECACNCGQILLKYDSQWRERRYIEKHTNKNKDTKPSNYKGGARHSRGYNMIYKPEHFSSFKSGYVMEHRYVFEIYYNCCLLSTTIIHHIDGNKLNNKIENLEPMTQSEHMKKYYKRKNKEVMAYV